MKRTLLITGASGFLGSNLAREAQDGGYTVRGFVRPTSDIGPLALSPEHIFRGDITNGDALQSAMRGADCVVHCAATTSEMRTTWEQSYQSNVTGTERVIAACESEGITDLIYISSQSAKPDNPSIYGRTKLEGEKRITASRLNFRIIRPNVIYGPGSKGLFAKMSRLVQKLPVIPVIGSGEEQLRPIYIRDLTGALLQCLETPVTVRRTYDLGGADVVTFNEFLRHLITALDLRRRLLHIPLPLCLVAARLIQTALPNPPVTVDNIHGLKLLDPSTNESAIRDFKYQPLTLAEGLRATVSA